MGGSDYDFGVALATQLAQARDRLTAHLTEAVKRELDEVQYRLVIDCGCALERALQGQESTELEELRTEIAELRAEIARGTNGRLLQLEGNDGGLREPSAAQPKGVKGLRRPEEGEGVVEEEKAQVAQAEEEEKLMWKRAVQESDRRKAAQKASLTTKSAPADEEPLASAPEPQAEAAPEPLVEAASEHQGSVSEPQAAAVPAPVVGDSDPWVIRGELEDAAEAAEAEEEPGPEVGQAVPAGQPESGLQAAPRPEPEQGLGGVPEPPEVATQQQEHSQGQGDEPGSEDPGRGHVGESPQARQQAAAEPGERPKAAKTADISPAHAATATPARSQAELLEMKRLAEVAAQAAHKPKTGDEPKLAASDLKALCKPYLHDQECGEGRLWIVVGGEDTGGIVVRKGESLTSERYPFRLSRGTTLEELDLVGNRLHYKRIRGDGPDWGWVNVMHKDKPLIELDTESK